ncbi:Processing of GAS1 and ALP protein 2 [[Candida] zeylanoides]|jgi:hypothetical protein
MFEVIFDYVERDDFFKYLRLTVLVAAYVIVRKYYSQWASYKQVKRQIEIAKREREAKPEKDRAAREALEASLAQESQTFGWGKKTRESVKLSANLLEAEAADLRQRHQTAYDAAEDHDIEDLLED